MHMQIVVYSNIETLHMYIDIFTVQYHDKANEYDGW